MLSSALLALTGLATLVTATPIAPSSDIPSRVQPLQIRQGNPTNSTAPPCAQVSQIMYGDGGRFARSSKVPAGIAYACLKTVPVNATSGKQLLQALPTYLQWQSTLTALKNPPAEYRQKVQPPTDLLGGLKLIEANLDAGNYESEYEFGWSLYTLILSAHDGHLTFVPDSVGGVFNWGRDVPLVSVSEDGEKLPSVFAYEDILGTQYKNISYTPSRIVKIDGKDVTEFLEHLSQFGSLQDRDGLYNNVFYELAQISMGYAGSGTGLFTGGGRARLLYPGATTTLTFENGSSYTMENYARVNVNFQNIHSGEDLAKNVFYFGFRAAEVQALTASAPPTDGPSVGYPKPVTEGPGGLINGFYIDDPEYQDVAVLQVPNFVGDSSAEIGFQRTSQIFLPKAVQDGKTKLIIDLQANGGGTILQGYDMFKQLFPSIDPYGGNRFRAHESLDLIGQSFSAYASQFDRNSSVNYTIRGAQATYFDYHNDMTIDGKPFKSWDEKFGPYEANGDKYTTPHRWNLSDVHITYSSGGINITGYGSLANASSKAPPFKPENIVLLTDGYCASTCTIFSELMTKQAGVKTIAMGGRSNSDPIQAVGGVKGTNNYGFSYLQGMAQQAFYFAPGDLKGQLNTSVMRDYYNDVVFIRSSGQSGVNVRDGLGYGDDSGVALQFKYEEADCRLYYTPEMTVDATAIWKAAAGAQWGGSGKCVGGSSDYGKREARKITTSLKKRGAQRVSSAAFKKAKAFEDTFGLETLCNWDADGFMRP